MKSVTQIAAAFALLASLVLASGVGAHSYRHGSVAVGHMWAPPQAGRGAGVPVYGVMVNKGQEPVRLVGASTPVARDVSLRARPAASAPAIEHVVLQPGRPLALAEWGPVLWIEDISVPLINGDMIPLTLDFGPDGKIDIEVAVEDGSSH